MLRLWAMLPIRAIGYNPLSCCSENRWNDVIRETRNFDFVFLAGTCVKSEGSISNFWNEQSHVVSTGYKHTPWSNKSCGCSVVIGKRFSGARQFPVIEAGGKLQGRGIASRIQNSLGHFNLIVAYSPPRPWAKRSHGKYRDTCLALGNWVNEQLCCTPGNCTPIFFADVNAGLGLRQCGAELLWDDATCVSRQAARKENFSGGAGETLRAILESHDLGALS